MNLTGGWPANKCMSLEKLQSKEELVNYPWNIAEDTESLGGDLDRLEKSEQPLPAEARAGFEAFRAAEGDIDKQLEALRRIQAVFEDYDPVMEEKDANDARAYVNRMILSLESGRE